MIDLGLQRRRPTWPVRLTLCALPFLVLLGHACSDDDPKVEADSTHDLVEVDPDSTTDAPELPPDATEVPEDVEHDIPPTSDCGFSDDVTYDIWGEIWQLRSQDGTTCVRLVRRNDSEPDVIYKAVPFTLLSLTLDGLGLEPSRVVIEDPEKLHYNSTHHNWYDRAWGTSDSARYVLNIDYDPTEVTPDYFFFSLVILAPDGDDVLWGPVSLFAVR